MTGNRNKSFLFLYGILNVKPGAVCLGQALKWNQETFQEYLRHLRSQWRAWRVVLFLNRGSPHTSKRSRRIAKALGIELRWLPTACPELDPIEGIWRYLKRTVLVN